MEPQVVFILILILEDGRQEKLLYPKITGCEPSGLVSSKAYVTIPVSDTNSPFNPEKLK